MSIDQFTQPKQQRSPFIEMIMKPRVLLGGVIPAALYYLVQSQYDGVTAVIVAGGWSIGVVIVTYALEREINGLALLGVILSGIATGTTIITQNEDFFLARVAVSRGMFGLLCLASLFTSKSLIQILAEEFGIPDHVKHIPVYKPTWRLVTAVWGVSALALAGLFLIMQFTLPLETFLSGRVIVGNIASIALFWFSFTYPSRRWQAYFAKQRVDESDSAHAVESLDHNPTTS
jgi:intracellular septation protein A